MLIEDQLTRFTSSKVKKSLKEIYSAEKPLSDADYRDVLKVLDAKKSAPIYYVDVPGTPQQIKETILHFAMKQELLEKGKGLVVSIDHATLVKGKSGEAEKAIIDELMTNFLELKKYFASIGLRCIFLVLSQLNRDIERPERTANRLLHYPTRNDIFAASSIYHCSDYVMISHRPANINGIKDFYGPPIEGRFPEGLPTKAADGRHMIYWHLIKERFGKTVIMTMVEDFKNATVEQINI
jgi:DnaB-like helicase C terminal domain